MMLLDIDPNLVKPGWTPLIILIGLALIMALLFFSMMKQFRKINVPGDPRPLPVEPNSQPAQRD